MFCVKMLFYGDLLENKYLFQIFHSSITIKNSESVKKSGYFEKSLRWRAHILLFLLKANTKSLVQKCYCFPNLLGSQYLFEILHTPLIVKNSENKIKVDVSKNLQDGELYFFKSKFSTRSLV